MTITAQFRDAVLANDINTARDLLHHDATLATQSLAASDDDYPLYRATEQGNWELVKLFLEYGADVDKPEQCGTGGAIHCAVTHGHYDIANLLLDHQANVDATPDSDLPMVSRLYNAAMDAGASPELIRKGFENYLGPADVDAPSEDAPDVVKLFWRVLSMGGQPGMFSVVRHEHRELVRDLLTYCPTEPGTKFDWPQGTLFFNTTNAASWLGYPEMLELCRDTCPELYDAATAQLSVCRAIGSHNRDGCFPEYRRLVENQLNFLKGRNELDVTRMTPLHWLGNSFIESRTYGFKCQQLPTTADLIDFAKLFLAYGFDVNFRAAETNMTALAVAAGDGPSEYVEFLIQHGADRCTDDPDETNPLAISKRKGRTEIVKLLIDGGSE